MLSDDLVISTILLLSKNPTYRLSIKGSFVSGNRNLQHPEQNLLNTLLAQTILGFIYVVFVGGSCQHCLTYLEPGWKLRVTSAGSKSQAASDKLQVVSVINLRILN